MWGGKGRTLRIKKGEGSTEEAEQRKRKRKTVGGQGGKAPRTLEREKTPTKKGTRRAGLEGHWPNHHLEPLEGENFFRNLLKGGDPGGEITGGDDRQEGGTLLYGEKSAKRVGGNKARRLGHLEFKLWLKTTIKRNKREPRIKT